MSGHDYTIKVEGGKRYLIIDYRGSGTSASIADFPSTMREVIEKASKTNPDIIVLSDVYESIYDEKQTQMIKEIGELADLFSREGVWTPSRLGKASDEVIKERNKQVLMIAQDLLKTDPVLAYLELIELIKKEKQKAASSGDDTYLRTLAFMYNAFERTTLIKRVKLILKKLGGKIPKGRAIYHTLFQTQIKPAFVSSNVFFHTPANVELVDQYMVEDATVTIYRHPEKVQFLYYINPPEYNLTPEKYFLLSKTRELVSSYRPQGVRFMTPEDIRNYFIKIYERTITDLAQKNNITITGKETQQLSRIVARYTVGYGMMELLLRDRKLTDVYMDAPLGTKPVYVVHGEYGSCQTNVLFTDEEAQGIISRFRSLSGRPFDEAHPVLDLDLSSLQTRVAVIGPPLSPDGIALALRLHKQTPWTLPQFIDVKMVNPLAAGLLSFLIDAQASTLVNGSRGAGKTSMLMSLMLEILPSARIIVQEDTLEIPVPYMKKLGFNIQRLKTQSAIAVSRTSAEVPPEEALRTALRLGDSVLIVGEVRSKEAKVLYEAMRVGAVGNVVMGTIHGENAYSVWDRIVNDLGVPNTSFKATDVVVTSAPVRFKGSLKRNRRLVEITEVGKHWYKDPEKEGGLINILEFDAEKDTHYLNEEGLKRSELFPRIAKKRGLKVKDLWDDIYARADTKNYLVEMKRKYGIPELLEAKYTVPANDKWLLILENQRQAQGFVDWEEAKKEWKEWVLKEQVQRLVQRRRQIEAIKKKKIAAAKAARR